MILPTAYKRPLPVVVILVISKQLCKSNCLKWPKKLKKVLGQKEPNSTLEVGKLLWVGDINPSRVIFFLEANNNPMVLGQENKGDTEAFHSHTLLMTSDLGAVLHQQHTWRQLVTPWLLCVHFLFVTQKCCQLQSSHAQSNLFWSCLGCPTTQRP